MTYNDFEILAKSFGTDKFDHKYLPIYWELFEHKRLEVKRVLEIGVLGGASLRLWKQMFPNADVVGVDTHVINVEGCRVVGCAQERIGSVMPALFDGGEIDLIIDDGCHHSKSQIATFQQAYPYLRVGGYYIVEDIYPSMFGTQFLDFLLHGFVYPGSKVARGREFIFFPPPLDIKFFTVHRRMVVIQKGRTDMP